MQRLLDLREAAIQRANEHPELVASALVSLLRERTAPTERIVPPLREPYPSVPLTKDRVRAIKGCTCPYCAASMKHGQAVQADQELIRIQRFYRDDLQAASKVIQEEIIRWAAKRREAVSLLMRGLIQHTQPTSIDTKTSTNTN